MKGKSESEVAESCPTLSDPMDCGPPGSSIHGIFQARVLEWDAIVTPYKSPDWMNHKLESRLLGEISITSDMQMTPLLWQNVKRN